MPPKSSTNALEANPKYKYALRFCANFLAYKRNDWDAAELMYKRALEAYPTDSSILDSYARFLKNKSKNGCNRANISSRELLEVDHKVGRVERSVTRQILCFFILIEAAVRLKKLELSARVFLVVLFQSSAGLLSSGGRDCGRPEA